MDGFYAKLLLCFVSAFIVSGEIESSTADSEQVVPRYVVFPGLDAGLDEVAEWSVGYASPFNVFFGPKPYVLGWAGEDSFVPIDEDEELGEDGEEEEDGEIDYEEGLEGEEEEEGVEENPEYDYEKV